jgi:transcriptional regulator with XRE-family HTH domain
MKTTEYLQSLKQRQGITSDYALARFLGVSRQTVSQWQSGVHFPDVKLCYIIADALGRGFEPQRIIADIEMERAERAGDDSARAFWQQNVQRIDRYHGRFAAVILSLCFWSGGPDGGAYASTAAPSPVKSAVDRLYIMSTHSEAD